jgi:hypothetical protein
MWTLPVIVAINDRQNGFAGRLPVIYLQSLATGFRLVLLVNNDLAARRQNNSYHLEFFVRHLPYSWCALLHLVIASRTGCQSD